MIVEIPPSESLRHSHIIKALVDKENEYGDNLRFDPYMALVAAGSLKLILVLHESLPLSQPVMAIVFAEYVDKTRDENIVFIQNMLLPSLDNMRSIGILALEDLSSEVTKFFTKRGRTIFLSKNKTLIAILEGVGVGLSQGRTEYIMEA